jgi:sugar phosphate isomerase/epimerase
MAFDDVLRWAEREDVGQIGLVSLRHPEGWQDAVSKVRHTSIAVPYLCHARMFTYSDPSSWARSRQRLIATIDAAVEVGADAIYTTTGSAGPLDYVRAVEALTEAVAPVREYAESAGIKLLVETANPFYAGSHFLHTLQDTIDATGAAGLGICLDLHAVWWERELHSKIEASSERIGLVQVSDFVAGNVSTTRDIVGDGMIPIESILSTLLRAGYQLPVDLELAGRPAETALEDILTSIHQLGRILDSIDDALRTA